MSQLHLLRDRRFAAIFWTQFLGAFNDNLFKNALLILIAYKSLSLGRYSGESLVALSAGIFIVPFFFFSALAGQLCDRFSKTTVIRWVKLAEIALMAVGALSFMQENLPFLLVTLFLTGLQSTLFGPAKYSILPELLAADDLTGGNALIETGTFFAILLGTVAGGLLIAFASWGPIVVGAVLFCCALLGWITSRLLPATQGRCPGLIINLNPVVPLLQTLRATWENATVLLAILAISWFWFFGASLLTILPTYTKDILGADEHVVTFLLAVFCVGTALGSLICERVGGKQLELGLVPIGSLGMSLAAFDLFMADGSPFLSTLNTDSAASLLGLAPFLKVGWNLRITIDFFFLAIFGGLYTVPLYTLLQQRTVPTSRSRVIAGNNIVNALFMVLSALGLMGAAAIGWSIPTIFLTLALLNGAMAVYIYRANPEFLFRFAAWSFARVIYRLRIVGRDNIPLVGPALLLMSPEKKIDWLLLSTATQREIFFVMPHPFRRKRVAHLFLRGAKIIATAAAVGENSTIAEDPVETRAAVAAALSAGELVCVFSNTRWASDRELAAFHSKIDGISPMPVVPISFNYAPYRKPRAQLVIGERKA